MKILEKQFQRQGTWTEILENTQLEDGCGNVNIHETSHEKPSGKLPGRIGALAASPTGGL